MAQSLSFGLYRDLGDEPVLFPVKASATWNAGDFLKLDAGYLTACAAGDKPVGVAVSVMDSDSTPAASGDVDALVYVGPNNHYRFPPDAGTVGVTLLNKTMDLGGAASVDIDAATDNCLLCVEVDVDANELIVQLIPANCASTVV